MTDRPRLDEEGLPVFDVLEEGDPTAMRRVVPGRGVGPARGAGVAVGFLVILVAGIALGTLQGDGDSRRATSAHPTDFHIVAGPTASGEPCTAQPAEARPTLTMAVTGVPFTVEALVGTGYHSGQEVVIAPTWLVPPVGRAIHVRPADIFDVTTKEQACIRSLEVSYQPTASLKPGPGGDGRFREVFRPTARGITFVGIPVGDWVIRAEAHYEMLGDDPAAEIVTVSYFRVIAGGGGPQVTDVPVVTPVPTPVATPIVPCGTGAATPDLLVRLEGGLDGPVAGVPDTSDRPDVPQPAIPVVNVALGDQVRIITDRDLCAVAWDIQLRDVAGSGPGGHVAIALNPTEDLAVAAQNRWPLPPTGDQVLAARLHFPGGLDIVRLWRITVQPFVVPAAFLVGPDGARLSSGFSCGLEVALHNGYNSSDSCGGIDDATDSPALHVPAYRPVGFEVPGWTIRSWAASCGTIVDFAFTVTDGCDLGGGTADNGSSLASPPTFLVPPGDRIVLVHADAIRANGDQYSIDYFVRVIAR